MHQSVFDNVAAGLKFRGFPRAEVKRVLTGMVGTP